MSKQLEKLTEKALRTGFANLNGRYYKGKFYSTTDRWETAKIIEEWIKEK